MGVVQVRQIRLALEKSFDGLIDLSDYATRPVEEQIGAFLSRALAAYAIAHLAGADPEASAKSVVDGFDDNGIDAIFFNPGDRQLFIVQSKWMAAGAGSPGRGEIQKFVQGVRDLLVPRFERFNTKVRARRAEIESALDDTSVSLVVVVSYTGSDQIAEHPRRDIEDLLTELNDPVDWVSFVPLSQRELHRAIASAAEGSPVRLEAMLHEWGMSRDPFLSYYGQVSAADVASWWQDNGPKLLIKNLRKFLGTGTEVNSGMLDTLRTTPERFWYYNNGITALCSQVTKKPIGGAERSSGVFVCDGVSIVNGAQTVGSIAQAFATHPNQVQRARVAVRFISLETGPEELSTDITRATNTQNRIERRDFAALDPEQDRLRSDFFLEFNLEYSYKSGDPTPLPAKGCSLDEAAVALACAYNSLALAVQAKREVGKIYEDIERPPYKLLFNAGTTALRVWRCVQVMRIVDAHLAEIQKGLEGRERMVAVHGNRFILHQVFKALPEGTLEAGKPEIGGLTAVQRPAVEQLLRALIQVIAKQYAASYLNSLFKNQQKCKHLDECLAEG